MGDCGWIVRDGLPKDANYIIPSWVKQLAKGPDAKDARGKGAPPSWANDEFCIYFATMQPIVEGLLLSGLTVRVACLPDRPAAILAWSVMQGNVLYGVGVHSVYKKTEFEKELALAALGDAVKRKMSMRLDIVDFDRPAIWEREKGWQASLRKCSERALLTRHLFGTSQEAESIRLIIEQSRDPVHKSVVRHIYDPTRTPWMPRGEKRAA